MKMPVLSALIPFKLFKYHLSKQILYLSPQPKLVFISYLSTSLQFKCTKTIILQVLVKPPCRGPAMSISNIFRNIRPRCILLASPEGRKSTDGSTGRWPQTRPTSSTTKVTSTSASDGRSTYSTRERFLTALSTSSVDS